jgi:hypothetical protein
MPWTPRALSPPRESAYAAQRLRLGLGQTEHSSLASRIGRARYRAEAHRADGRTTDNDHATASRRDLRRRHEGWVPRVHRGDARQTCPDQGGGNRRPDGRRQLLCARGDVAAREHARCKEVRDTAQRKHQLRISTKSARAEATWLHSQRPNRRDLPRNLLAPTAGRLSNGFDTKLLAVVVIAVLHALYLALFVTEAGVFEAARTYARQLLLCTQSPHLGGQPKPTAVRKPRKPKPTASENAGKSETTGRRAS